MSTVIMKAMAKYRSPLASLMIVGAVLMVLFVFSKAPVYSLTATITTDKAAAGASADYTLGQRVQFPVTLSFSDGESIPTGATIEVQGSVPFNPIAIPLTTGTHDLTSSLPAGHFLPAGTYDATTGNVSLSAVVSYTNMVDPYGYGYGYVGGTGGGTVNITVSYKPPIFKYPAPAPLAGPLNNPTFAFTVGTVTTPGPGPTSGLPSFPEMKFANSAPPIPDSPYDACVIDTTVKELGVTELESIWLGVHLPWTNHLSLVARQSYRYYNRNSP